MYSNFFADYELSIMRVGNFLFLFFCFPGFAEVDEFFMGSFEGWPRDAETKSKVMFRLTCAKKGENSDLNGGRETEILASVQVHVVFARRPCEFHNIVGRSCIVFFFIFVVMYFSSPFYLALIRFTIMVVNLLSSCSTFVVRMCLRMCGVAVRGLVDATTRCLALCLRGRLFELS